MGKKTVVMSALVAFAASFAGAETYTWIGGASGQWTDRANWKQGETVGVAYPGETDEGDLAIMPYSETPVAIEVASDVLRRPAALGAVRQDEGVGRDVFRCGDADAYESGE